MSNGDWTQIKVTVARSDLDETSAIMSMIDTGLMIEDYSDLDLKTCYGDLIDESLLNADKTIASVSVFLPPERSCIDNVAFLRERFGAVGIKADIKIEGINEEDWANSWKEYYKPLHIGGRIVIVPMWEAYTPKDGELIVRMDPGMAFGTGTHETTRLVIELLEKYTNESTRMLDVGCGSGILAMCASKLGAKCCAAYDLDAMAVRVARENIKAGGFTNITCNQSDLLRQVDTADGKFDLITANIVADIIIRMAPEVAAYMTDNATLIVSGIITERADEVTEALLAGGLKIKERRDDNGWCAIALGKNI